MNQDNSKENSSKKEDQNSTIMMKKNKIQLEPLDE